MLYSIEELLIIFAIVVIALIAYFSYKINQLNKKLGVLSKIVLGLLDGLQTTRNSMSELTDITKEVIDHLRAPTEKKEQCAVEFQSSDNPFQE